MIKRYDNYLIPPIKSSMSYPIIDYSLPKGETFTTAMSISSIRALHYYYYSAYYLEVKVELVKSIDFTQYINLKRPKLRSTSFHHKYGSWFFYGNVSKHCFRTFNEAYIDMFLNYPSTINEYPDIYRQLYTKYPEYFI